MSGSGILVQIAEKRSFDFSFLAEGTTQTEVVARAVNVVPYARLGLLTRVHANGMGASTSFDILVANVYPSDVDQQPFVQAVTITRNIAPSDSAGTFYTDFATGMGPFVQVSIRANQHATTATRLQAQLSVGLLLRVDPV